MLSIRLIAAAAGTTTALAPTAGTTTALAATAPTAAPDSPDGAAHMVYVCFPLPALPALLDARSALGRITRRAGPGAGQRVPVIVGDGPRRLGGGARLLAGWALKRPNGSQ